MYVYKLKFSKLYTLYLDKISKKERLKKDLDFIITWLSGYTLNELDSLINSETTTKEFIDNFPKFNECAYLIKGSICGVKIQEIEDEVMFKIRCLDKLVDELYKGKTINKICFLND